MFKKREDRSHYPKNLFYSTELNHLIFIEDDYDLNH